MVQEPSHVKQLSPIHVCKIGLSQDKVNIQLSNTEILLIGRPQGQAAFETRQRRQGNCSKLKSLGSTLRTSPKGQAGLRQDKVRQILNSRKMKSYLEDNDDRWLLRHDKVNILLSKAEVLLRG
jgi:hypothetical protein